MLGADNQPLYEITVAGDGVVAYVEAHDDTDRANATLIAKAPEMASLLRELEWADTGERGFSDSDLPDTRCPVCHAYGYRGHSPDCRLATLLRELA